MLNFKFCSIKDQTQVKCLLEVQLFYIVISNVLLDPFQYIKFVTMDIYGTWVE